MENLLIIAGSLLVVASAGLLTAIYLAIKNWGFTNEPFDITK